MHTHKSPGEGAEELPPEANKCLAQEEGANLLDYVSTPADHLLCTVVGDYLHKNDGAHLDSRIAHNALWQSRWDHVVNLCQRQ